MYVVFPIYLQPAIDAVGSGELGGSVQMDGATGVTAGVAQRDLSGVFLDGGGLTVNDAVASQSGHWHGAAGFG